MKKTYKSTRKNYQPIDSNTSLVEEPIIAFASGFNSQIASLLGLNTVSPISDLDFIKITRKGLSKDILLNISKILGATQEKLSELMHVTPRTLQRLKPNEPLDIYTTEQTIEMAKVASMGLAFFGNVKDFQTWLNTPIISLNNQKPLDLLDTSFGCSAVINTLNRIQHGIYA